MPSDWPQSTRISTSSDPKLHRKHIDDGEIAIGEMVRDIESLAAKIRIKRSEVEWHRTQLAKQDLPPNPVPA